MCSLKTYLLKWEPGNVFERDVLRRVDTLWRVYFKNFFAVNAVNKHVDNRPRRRSLKTTWKEMSTLQHEWKNTKLKEESVLSVNMKFLRFLSWDQLKSLSYDWPYLTESNKLKHAIRHVFIMAQNERRSTRAQMKHAACSVSARTSSEIIKYDFLII